MKKLAILITALVLVFGFSSTGFAAAYVGTAPGWSFPNFGGDLGDSFDEEGGFSWEYLHVGYNFSDTMGINLLWGQAAGEADGDVDWTNNYIDVDFRYTMKMDAVSPYFEVGLGSYSFDAEGDGFELEADPMLGWRLALGGIIPVSQFYLAPEFSYHWVELDEGDLDIDGLGSGSIDDIGPGNFGLLSLKIGYMFGG